MGRSPREAFAQRNARLLDEREREAGDGDKGARTEHSDEPVAGGVTHCKVFERRDPEHQR